MLLLSKKKNTRPRRGKKNAWTRSTEEGTEIIFDELSVELIQGFSKQQLSDLVKDIYGQNGSAVLDLDLCRSTIYLRLNSGLLIVHPHPVPVLLKDTINETFGVGVK